MNASSGYKKTREFLLVTTASAMRVTPEAPAHLTSTNAKH